jgi:RNA polymerase-interacting CarD/CdnL/TRCF family regulator
MNVSLFQPGDRVFHPIYGLGVVEGLMTRDQASQRIECYGVRISDGATLFVPVDRAEALGLRPIINSLAGIVACLHSPAQPLPDDDRLRFVELKARSQAPESMALSQAVRDLLNRGRDCRLTPADHKWLDNACERLSAEASWVDEVDLDHARTVIRQEVNQFKPDKASAPTPSKKHKSGANK